MVAGTTGEDGEGQKRRTKEQSAPEEKEGTKREKGLSIVGYRTGHGMAWLTLD